MRVVRQRAEWDCAVAALNTIAPHLPYGSLVAALSFVGLEGRGLYNREVAELAAAFGIRLEPTRRADRLDTGTGVLRLYWNRRDRRARRNPGGHFVAVGGGRILDPDTGSDLPWREYASRHGARLGTLLERA